ncbi:bifunctional purine biosynthesis protein PurH [Striga asiatica]|uniref:Bifunctional purine biosynthesis protein PurH n=1 Tax=Striga asiatica TaxID=4170 RepID=A0A5A7PE66_STRAF|nr:bifunctional purine biosynthesis protein PurH [Striga asiatica]
MAETGGGRRRRLWAADRILVQAAEEVHAASHEDTPAQDPALEHQGESDRTIKKINGQVKKEVEKANFLGEVENRMVRKEGATFALFGEKIGREMAPAVVASVSISD